MEDLLEDRTRELRESEKRQRQIIENTEAGYFFIDRDGLFRHVNDAWLQMHRYDSVDEVVGKHFALTQVDEDLEQAQKIVETLLSGGPIPSGEFSRRCKDGSIAYHTFTVNPVVQTGQVIGLEGFFIDITGRKLAEKALKENESKHRTLIEGIPDIVMRFDRDGRHLFVSDNVNELVDLQSAQFIGKTHRELGFPEAHCALWEEAIRSVYDSGELFEKEFSFQGKRGLTIFNWRLIPEFGQDGRPCSVLSISRDVTEHRKAERDYKTLFNEMLDGLALHEIICDVQGRPVDYRFLAVNPAFERMTGLKAQDITGKTILDVLPNTELYWIETYGKVALTGEPAFFENYAHELGKHFEVTAFRPSLNQFACIFADITDRKQAEEEHEKLAAQLRQAQKMEAVGQLAGGIAHDFNNLLQVILGYGEAALDEAEAESPVRASVDEMLKAGNRAKTLVSQLLAFSRRQVLEMKDLNLNDVIANVMKILRRVIGEHITLEAIYGHDLGIVNADRGQIEQILMNMCVNARDAMPTGGRIIIETENVKIDQTFCESHSWAKPGRYVLLSMTDTGCGMDEETLGHVFEPFFTTKDVGEGSGLGLAMIYGLVKQHQGMITVYSEVGKGTTFKIYLPLVERAASSVGNKIKGPVPGGTETILVAEDDETVLKISQAFLERAGYTVLTATDGEKALHVFEDHTDEIDLVLLDVMMPELGGRAVFERIREKRPQMRVLFSSGYSMNAIHTNFVIDEGLQLMQKPYQRTDLLRKVREVLDKE